MSGLITRRQQNVILLMNNTFFQQRLAECFEILCGVLFGALAFEAGFPQ